MNKARDFAALCAAIDAGDDSALHPLADWLEEQGDERAAGLRIARRFTPWRSHRQMWAWTPKRDGPTYSSTVHDKIIQRLGGCAGLNAGGELVLQDCNFITRSSAFLALAEAMSEEEHAHA